VFSISIWHRLKIQSQVQNWGRNRKKGDTVKPRFKEVPRDWGNWLIISRIRYIEVLFHTLHYYWAEEYGSWYRGCFPYITLLLGWRMWFVISRVLFHTFYYYWAEEYGLLYRGSFPYIALLLGWRIWFVISGFFSIHLFTLLLGWRMWFVISGFFSIHCTITGLKNMVRYIGVLFHTFIYTITGLKNIVRYTEDFVIKRFVKSRFQCI